MWWDGGGDTGWGAGQRTIDTMDRWVSSGIPTVHPIMCRASRPESGSMSHGWTSTAASSAAACCRKVTNPSSSRSLVPAWLPMCTPTWPFSIERSSSRHASSTWLSGTWQRACNRPCEAEHISSAASLKWRATSSDASRGRSHWKRIGVALITCEWTPNRSRSSSRARTSQQAFVTGRKSASPDMSIALQVRS